MNHTQLIQQLIDENGYESYLEIGYGTGVNFNAINVKNKVAIDPGVENIIDIFNGTSDEYFAQLDGRKKFDIVFVDGLHYADQVERDVINSMKHLKKGGVIVVHDINPPTLESTIIPRQQRVWCGTVYQAWIGLKINYPDILTRVYLDDYGIGLIYHTTDKITEHFSWNLPFDEFNIDRINLLGANDYENLINE